MSANPVLEVVPKNHLLFQRCARTNSVVAPLTLQNNSSGYVAFKIKTTAPKVYIVKPNSGVIESGGCGQVQVQVHPLADDSGRQADRFLVQSIPVESKTVSQDFWQVVNKESVEEIRLSVKFPETDNTSASNTASGLDMHSVGQVSHIAQKGKDVYKELVEYSNALHTNIAGIEEKISNLKRELNKDSNDVGDRGKSVKRNTIKELTFTEAVLIVAVAIIVLGYLKLI